MLSTQTVKDGRHIFPLEIREDKDKKQLIIGYLKRGDSFGEHSSLNDIPNPFSIEATTKQVELYKILRSNFVSYFGGLEGEPVSQIRASILLKTNWLREKIELIKSFTVQ